ncbi:MAG: DUF192 domain-containing protein [Chloroflexi bacterium]|nr:DUF192 domain-containing protein [Chloroflexota bacterium]MDA1002611.1 DUF192 domain-containing protein [Chloroflexota bacterium]
MRHTGLALFAVCALIALFSGCGDAAAPAGSVTATTPSAAATTTATAGSAPDAGGAPTEQVASTAAIPTDALPRVVFERADGSTVALPVEVPPRDEYSIGLSGRDSVEGRGMVFYYPGGADNAGFWMSRTHVDLAIAFVTTEGVISEIHEMTAESLEITRPAMPYEFAVEAPAGWYAAHDLAPGDVMRPDFDVHDYVD